MSITIDIERIKDFLVRLTDQEIDETLIKTRRFNSLSNKIMLFSYEDLSYIYREFGQIDEFVDRTVESRLNSCLADAGYTAKFLESTEKYRIEEYLHDTQNLPFTKLLEDDTIQFMSEVVNFTSKVYDVYILESAFSPINLTRNLTVNAPQTSFNLLINKLLPKGIKNFEKFKASCTDPSLQPKIEMFSDVLETYEERLKSLKLEDSLFVVSHNDNHRLNILENTKDGKLFLIDFEFGCLSPVGADLANYLAESVYDHDIQEPPYYTFDFALFDFEKFFAIYTKAVKRTLDDFADYVGDKREYYLSRQYFAKLFNHQNYFWFIFCFIYMDYDNYVKGQSWYFDHAFTRMKLVEKICEFNFY